MHLLTVRYVFIINLPKKLYIYRMQNKHLISTLILLTLIVGVQMVLHPEAKLPFLDYCRYFRYPT
jgi:pimeloyl-ACP methyl ester carboxylesterase